MALNTETGIDPVVDRFVIWKVSTSQFINMNATWIRFDGGAVERLSVSDGIGEVLEMRHIGEGRGIPGGFLARFVVKRVATAAQGERALRAVESDEGVGFAAGSLVAGTAVP